jgi:hypothetical protein
MRMRYFFPTGHFWIMDVAFHRIWSHIGIKVLLGILMMNNCNGSGKIVVTVRLSKVKVIQMVK